jgi:hypothetical protein
MQPTRGDSGLNRRYDGVSCANRQKRWIIFVAHKGNLPNLSFTR